jgi:hypothetical protein
MLGFLFGNVDENNKLDADYLDEVRSPGIRCLVPLCNRLLCIALLTPPPLSSRCRRQESISEPLYTFQGLISR